MIFVPFLCKCFLNRASYHFDVLLGRAVVWAAFPRPGVMLLIMHWIQSRVPPTRTTKAFLALCRASSLDVKGHCAVPDLAHAFNH